MRRRPGLFAIILMFEPVSGGHINPVASFVVAAFGGLSWRDATAYLPRRWPGASAVRDREPDVRHTDGQQLHQAPGHPGHFLSEIITMRRTG